jgi:hypothetical protein
MNGGIEKARTAIVYVLTVLQIQNLEPTRTNLSFPATATTVMERGGDGSGAPMSDGRHRRMRAHSGRASVHLGLLSFGYKYSTPPPPLAGRLHLRYAHPLPPLDVRDLDRTSGHMSKFNGLSYLVGRSLLNLPGGHANNDHRRNCNSDCNDNNVYGNDRGGGV